MATLISSESVESQTIVAKPSVWHRLLRHPSVVIGSVMVVLIASLVPLASVLTPLDPIELSPRNRNQPPGFEMTLRNDDGEKYKVEAIMGTDKLGRDVYTRVIYGARVSLIVGITVAVGSVAIDLLGGLLAGYFRLADAIIMRVMDGLMAIPAILLAIALVSLSGASLLTVILAIVIPEIPRVVRLVRSIVLTIREEPYVEAAISVGTPTVKILWRHVLPNTIAPLIVQGTFICGYGHPARSHSELPGRRDPARDPDLGEHHGRRARPVSDLSAQHLLPGHFPDVVRARGQHARRRPARHDRPAHVEGNPTWRRHRRAAIGAMRTPSSR